MEKDHVMKGIRIRRSDTAFDPVSAALQQLHKTVESEEIPDDFLKILGDIDAKIAAARGSSPE